MNHNKSLIIHSRRYAEICEFFSIVNRRKRLEKSLKSEVTEIIQYTFDCD